MFGNRHRLAAWSDTIVVVVHLNEITVIDLDSFCRGLATQFYMLRTMLRKVPWWGKGLFQGYLLHSRVLTRADVCAGLRISAAVVEGDIDRGCCAQSESTRE